MAVLGFLAGGVYGAFKMVRTPLPAAGKASLPPIALTRRLTERALGDGGTASTAAVGREAAAGCVARAEEGAGEGVEVSAAAFSRVSRGSGPSISTVTMGGGEGGGGGESFGGCTKDTARASPNSDDGRASWRVRAAARERSEGRATRAATPMTRELSDRSVFSSIALLGTCEGRE